VRGAWCVVRGAWCMVHGAWCMVHGAWCRVQGAGNEWLMLGGVGRLKKNERKYN
jgi:hypothetical protein